MARDRSTSRTIVSGISRLAAVACLVSLSGCSAWSQLTGASGGTVQVTSVGVDPVRVINSCETAVYSDSITSELTFFVGDRPYDDLSGDQTAASQVMRVDVLWEPTPGRTPMDDQATNLAIRYVINTGTEVGVYGGGGFGTLSGKDGGPKTLTIHDGIVRLQQSTPGFVDLLGATTIDGSFTATFDPNKTKRLHHEVSQHVTNAIGNTVIVQP